MFTSTHHSQSERFDLKVSVLNMLGEVCVQLFFHALRKLFQLRHDELCAAQVLRCQVGHDVELHDSNLVFSNAKTCERRRAVECAHHAHSCTRRTDRSWLECDDRQASRRPVDATCPHTFQLHSNRGHCIRRPMLDRKAPCICVFSNAMCGNSISFMLLELTLRICCSSSAASWLSPFRNHIISNRSSSSIS